MENSYLKYIEYVELGGTLPEMPFNVLEFKAQKEIDKYTYSRLVNLEEQKQEVKNCIFELINILNGYSNNIQRNSNINSESIDGYSVSYTKPSIELSQNQIKEIKNCIETYLSECKLDDGTPYLYV